MSVQNPLVLGLDRQSWPTTVVTSRVVLASMIVAMRASAGCPLDCRATAPRTSESCD